MQMSQANQECKGKIVLIDDDPELLNTARRLLESGGFEVQTYDRAFNASNFVARASPDLVLMDVNMPFLSGDQLAEIFSHDNELGEIPVVFFSSNDEHSLRTLVKDKNAVGYIQKSDLLYDFVGKVSRFVDRRRTSAARNTLKN